MWEVVKRTPNGEKVVLAGKSYLEALNAYTEEAKLADSKDKEGNYIHPDVRVSIRETSNE